MSHYDALLNFCKKYDCIYCYGAGNIGVKTALFLNKYGIKINGYIVSQKSENSILDISVYQIDEISPLLNERSGIILSVDKKYHQEILSNIIRLGNFNTDNIFFVTFEDVIARINLDLAEGMAYLCEDNEKMRGDLNVLFENILDLELNKHFKFKRRYIEIREKYKRIVFGQYYMRHIGEMCLTYYLWFIENKGKNDILYVMAPVLWDDDYGKVPNTYFFHKIQEKIEIITKENYEFWRWMLQHHADEIECSDKYSWIELKNRDMDYIDAVERCFEVEPDVEELKIIAQMNLGDEFICVYSRDNEYYRSMGLEDDTEEYRYATGARNSSIMDYVLLGEEYQKKKIRLVRMGYQAAESIKVEGIVDYANNYRNEKLDFYLISKCKFFMVSGSGIMLIAKLFNTPLIVVNSSVISFGGDMVTPMSPERDLIVMKKLWYPRQNRYLSLDEILYAEGKFQSYDLFNVYHDLGIEFCSNSQEELLEIAEEMRGRLGGKEIYTDEDERLQERYRAILIRNIEHSKNHYYNGRYSADFLRKNIWFLDEVPEELSIRNII